MIDRATIERVIDRAEIVDVVSDFVTLHRKGKDYIGLCPFHEDTRPSFSVSVSRNICKCFACGEGGNPVSFVMKHENISYPEAIKYLGRKYGIEVKETELTDEEKAARSAHEQLLNANSFARDTFTTCLHHESEGRRIGLSYFKERGLSDQIIKSFELGYSPVSPTYLVSAIASSGMPMETFEQLGLVMQTKRGDYIDRYRDRVIYPIHSMSGNVVGFGGRILVKKENTGKYINSPASSLYDKSRELYGMYFAKREISKQDRCLVVEGYMDVLSMHDQGVTNVVASSGTALTSEQVRMIRRYTSNVTFVFDSDAAGIKAALRGLDIALEKGMTVRVVLLPDGEDPDSYARSHTQQQILDYIAQEEVDGIRFKAHRLLGDQDDPQVRADALMQISETIAYIPDPLIREIYIQDTASLIGVDTEHLTQRIDEIIWDRKRERARRRPIAGESTDAIADSSVSVPDNDIESTPPTSPTDMPTMSGGTFGTSSFIAPRESHQGWSEPLQPTMDRRNPKVKVQSGVQDPFSDSEVALLHYIMEYGASFVPDYVTSDQHEGAQIIDIIREQTSDLRRSKELSPQFVLLLDDLAEQLAHQPDLNPKVYLSWHENPTILHYANQELTKEYKISEVHKRFMEDYTKPEEIKDRVMQEILSYKYDIVLRRISNTLKEIQALPPEEQSHPTPEVGKAIIERLAKLNRLKSSMARKLGDRVLNPLDRIYRT